MARILSHSSSGTKISPALLLVIVIVSAIFFILGTLHLVYRFVIKMPPFSSTSHSNRYSENSGSRSLRRQLQHLFRLHDSGLDQSVIDALPVFYYKDIMGLKEPFDCAVCLCVFSAQDQLRLIPMCSHAFHTHCIDTWLLSNSTCPLCRYTLNHHPSFPIEPPNTNNLNRPMEGGASEVCCDESGGINGKGKLGKRVLSIRLGKLRSLNEREGEMMSSCKLDGRRCFSMGSFQYVVGESELQVALFDVGGGCPVIHGDLDGKKIGGGKMKVESFSVSKVWLWSKKGKSLVSSSEAETSACSV